MLKDSDKVRHAVSKVNPNMKPVYKTLLSVKP